MSGHVVTASASRLFEVRIFLGTIRAMAISAGKLTISSEVKIAKGLFFVHLYGAYEFTVWTSFREVVNNINASNCPIQNCNDNVLGLVLDSECAALAADGREKTWEKRSNMFARSRCTDIAVIHSVIDPTGGKNLDFAQLAPLWNCLSVKDPILPRREIQGKVTELVRNRVDVAHGNSSPVSVGARYSLSDLEKILDDISELCSYVIQTFDSYTANKHYLA